VPNLFGELIPASGIYPMIFLFSIYLEEAIREFEVSPEDGTLSTLKVCVGIYCMESRGLFWLWTERQLLSDFY
jgi:hypothetical protein